MNPNAYASERRTRSGLESAVRFVRSLAASAAVLVFVACDSTVPPSLTSLIITNTWSVEGQPDRAFIFESVRDGRTSGLFTGREEIQTAGDPIVNDVSGFWESGRIEFTVGGTRGGALYTGAFRNLPRQLTVRSNAVDETIQLVAVH